MVNGDLAFRWGNHWLTHDSRKFNVLRLMSLLSDESFKLLAPERYDPSNVWTHPTRNEIALTSVDHRSFPFWSCYKADGQCAEEHSGCQPTSEEDIVVL